MAKYDYKLNLTVVQEYLNGAGSYVYLKNKYGIKSSTQIDNWVHQYRQFGKDGLHRQLKNKIYSVQFKLDAVEFYLTTGNSYQQVANILGIHHPSLIAFWVKTFRDEGVDGINRTKGRPPIMPERKKQKANSITEEQKKIEELEQELLNLKIENAFLKELRKRRKQEEKQQMRLSRPSSFASEDNSN